MANGRTLGMAGGLPSFDGGDLRAPERFADDRSLTLGAYGDLDDLITGAERAELLDVPAETRGAAIAGEANQVRAPVIAEQLWLLGYLDDPAEDGLSADPSRRAGFLAAVERFQDDAGLKRDSWAGEKTWKALQALVSFDYEAFGEHAFADRTGEPRPALVRALRLRLHALGLLDTPPRGAGDHTRLPMWALGVFWRVARRVGLATPGTPLPTREQLIALVFDQDRLVEAIGKWSESVRVGVRWRRIGGRRRRVAGRERLIFKFARTPGGVGAGELSDARRLERLVVNVAKIELWLLGFDVKIDGRHDYGAVGLEGHRPPQMRASIRAALRNFWASLGGRLRARAEEMSEAITPELFQALARPESTLAARRVPIDDVDYSRQVLEHVHSEEAVARAYAEGKGLGMKLWDGFKRLWRWIRRGIRKVLAIAHNLVRAFYRYALKAFQIARFAARTVTDSLMQYLGGQIRLPVEMPVRVHLAGDGDFRVIIGEQPTDEQLRLGTRRLRQFGAAFELSCRILGAVLGALRRVPSLALGLVGWARFLWVLVRSYRDIRPVFREARAL